MSPRRTPKHDNRQRPDVGRDARPTESTPVDGPLDLAALVNLPLDRAEVYLRRWRVRRALRDTGGNVRKAAAVLQVPPSTLATALRHPELTAEVQLTRRAVGAPSLVGPDDRAVVAAAWEKSGHSLRGAARILDRDPSTLRGQIIRYGLPDPPAPAHGDGRKGR
jgi:transcriptional regulator with GAF, ATPase, and Fis domain